MSPIPDEPTGTCDHTDSVAYDMARTRCLGCGAWSDYEGSEWSAPDAWEPVTPIPDEGAREANYVYVVTDCERGKAPHQWSGTVISGTGQRERVHIRCSLCGRDVLDELSRMTTELAEARRERDALKLLAEKAAGVVRTSGTQHGTDETIVVRQWWKSLIDALASGGYNLLEEKP